MKCEICKRELEKCIDYCITDNEGEKHYCPNCITLKILQGEIELTNSKSLICDILKKQGAVKFSCMDEEYYLEKDIMIRLLTHNLTKQEYITLVSKYGDELYMLHDDFYTIDGKAIQPAN